MAIAVEIAERVGTGPAVRNKPRAILVPMPMTVGKTTARPACFVATRWVSISGGARSTSERRMPKIPPDAPEHPMMSR